MTEPQEVVFLTYNELLALEGACHRSLHMEGVKLTKDEREIITNALRKLEKKADEANKRGAGF